MSASERPRGPPNDRGGEKYPYAGPCPEEQPVIAGVRRPSPFRVITDADADGGGPLSPQHTSDPTAPSVNSQRSRAAV